MPHLKRLVSPDHYKIPRKEHKWAVKPSPGPHPKDMCIPLLVLIRDRLKYARNSREGKKIIKSGKILVDGRVRKDYKFPVGLMDVVEIPDTGDVFRIVSMSNGRLEPIKIPEKEKELKLCRIEDKRYVKGGRIQLNLHDGRNILIDQSDVNKYKTMDSLLIRIPEQEILESVRFKEGVKILIIGGRHFGEIGTLSEIKIIKGPQPNVIRYELDGRSMETLMEYAFPVGEKEPVLTIR